MRIPDFQRLQAFEAVTRLKSTTAAAEELGVVPSAISHRLRALEEFLGFKLFASDKKGDYALTVAGLEFLAQVSEPMTELQRVCDELGASKSTVRITALPSFARTWLNPRIADLTANEPTMQIHVDASTDLFDMGRSVYDIALRFSPRAPQNHGAHSVKLMDDWVFAAASPSYLRNIDGSESERFAAARLVVHPRQGWCDWLPKVNAKAWRNDGPSLHISDTSMILDAVRDGLGIGLVRLSVAAEALKRGQVVNAFPGRIAASPSSYWLLASRRIETSRVVKRVVEFVSSEADAFRRYAPRLLESHA